MRNEKATTINRLIEQLNTAHAALHAAGVEHLPDSILENGTQETTTVSSTPWPFANCLHCEEPIDIGSAWCDDQCRQGRLLRDSDGDPLMEDSLYTDTTSAVWRMCSTPEMDLAYRPGQHGSLDPEWGKSSAADVVRERGPLTAQTEWRKCRNCRKHVLTGQTACSPKCLDASK